MIYWDILQESEAWFELRLGSVTSSRVDDVLAKTKDMKRESDRRKGYRLEKLAEHFSRRPYRHGVGYALLEGKENEPLARCEYELRTGCRVRQIGLATHPAIYHFSASTDGLVGTEGVLEIKCPQLKQHMDILTTKVIPSDWMNQMWAELSCTGYQWVDFMSYNPDVAYPLQAYITRFYRDEGLIRGIESEVILFLDQVQQAISDLEHDYESVSHQRLQTA
jgi:hypothetical protein